MRVRGGLLAVLLAMCAGLVACGDEADSGRTAQAGYQPRTVGEPLTRVCGVNKYNGPQGADVSKYQGDFDWAAQKSAGLAFGYARISDGTNIIDAKFDQNWRQMKANGILRGAYQFFRPGQDAAAQANMVVQKIGRLGPGDMPAMIDVEADDGQSKATVAAKVKQWIDIVEQGTGKKPVIYTGAYFWRDHVGSTAFSSYPLWIAAYGPSCPSLPPGWSDWTIWQYCNGQTQYCSNGQGFDRDVFNGSLSKLRQMADGGVDWSATYVDQSFPLAATAIKMVPGQTLSGYIELKNTGSKTWNSDTRLATTQPRDRNSIFADSTWLAPNRPAGVSGTVPPGQSYKFQFTLHAPNQPGTYHEYFGVVQEGVHWFSDPGQGGPPDDQLQVQIKVADAGDAGTTPDASGDAGTTPDASGGDAGYPDAGADAGPSADAGGDAPDSALGTLVSTSRGVQGGCSQAPESAPVSGALVGLCFVLGLVGLHRRRLTDSAR